MARLIDYQAAVDRYYTEFEKQDICDWEQDRDLLKQCFDESPTINPVHAAGACYCNECKFTCIGENEVESWCYCKMTNRNINLTDFCSWGQRREDLQ